MEKAKNIYFIDQTSEFDHHMVFNASMLKILNLIFLKQKHFHYGLESNINSIKTLLSEKDKKEIQFETIKHKKTSGSNLKKLFNYFRKEIYRVNNFIHILKQSNEHDWIVLSITTFTSFLWFKILKIFYKTNTIVVLHGDVDFVYKTSSLYEKINGLFYKLIFKIKAQNFYYLTLNKIEKRFLVDDGWLKDKEVLEIEHPFLNIEEKKEDNITLNTPISIGHIGSMEVKRKNSHYIFKLAEICKDLVNNNKISFRSIGLMTPNMIPYKNKLVDIFVGNEIDESPKYLSREDYEKELSSLDYIIFFYPKDEYVFRASGAVADFLAKNKPIICLKHPIFEYMFKHAGNIGYMCETLEEIKNLLEKITQNDDSYKHIYNEQIENIRIYKNNFSIHSVAKDLKKQLYKRI